MRKVNKSYLDYLALRNVPVSVSDAIAFVTFVPCGLLLAARPSTQTSYKTAVCNANLTAFIDMQISW